MAAPVGAQELVVYPAKGQSAEQQMKDKGECYAWAQQQTGFDLMTAEAPPQTVTTDLPKERVVGSGAAVRGAAVGAVTGAIMGDAGKGAAAGAAGGALIGTIRATAR